jgi:hypothetical protein
MVERLRLFTGNQYYNSSQEFDKKMKPILDKFDQPEDTLIKKDFSYHIVHFDTYESYAYEYYLK